MSYSVYVLCLADGPITRREIATFVKEGVYFAEPRFQPDHSSAEAAAPDWTRFVILGEPGGFRLTLHSGGVQRGAEVAAVVEGTFEEHGLDLPAHHRERLGRTRRVFELEIDRGAGVPDDGWELLSALESFLAHERDGVVFSSEDGIYDADLRLEVRLRS